MLRHQIPRRRRQKSWTNQIMTFLFVYNVDLNIGPLNSGTVQITYYSGDLNI